MKSETLAPAYKKAVLQGGVEVRASAQRQQAGCWAARWDLAAHAACPNNHVCCLLPNAPPLADTSPSICQHRRLGGGGQR